MQAGAEGITIHPRPDERHIRDEDVACLAEVIRGFPAVEFNIEGNPFEGKYVEHCERVRPHQCTLVPDSIAQSTSDHGWDLAADFKRLRPIVHHLKSLGCRVSLFMDPHPEQMPLAAEIGADRIELYTEPFARRFEECPESSFQNYASTALEAERAGLLVNAGHDLNLLNLGYFLDHVPRVAEVSIGHALIADALIYGLAATIQKYLDVCHSYNT
jgi:pyridoxine 5-phosphate synthase